MEINNEFRYQKKGRLSVNEYAAVLTEKMNLVPYLVPIELSMVNKFASGLLMDFGITVKLETTLKEAILAVRNVENKGKRSRQG